MDSLANLVRDLGGWSWMIFAALLLGIELLLPGFYLLWFSIAAAIVGIVVFSVDIAWTWQLVLFGICSVAVLFLGERYGSRNADSEDPLLNESIAQMIGERHRLQHPIENGRGVLLIGDGQWTISGPDLPRGADVRIVGAKGTILIVEAATDRLGNNLPKAGSFG
jgi:membrane protein implicated in regulation of membrane protease activity